MKPVLDESLIYEILSVVGEIPYGRVASYGQIARLCGFEDQSYFTKVFRRISGVTPKKYRDSRGGAKKEIVIR